MDGDIDDLTLVVEAGEIRQEDQVAGARNRQELGDSLDQGHDNQVEEGHGRRIGLRFTACVSHSESRGQKNMRQIT